jgi:hypothetical protein
MLLGNKTEKRGGSLSPLEISADFDNCGKCSEEVEHMVPSIMADIEVKSGSKRGETNGLKMSPNLKSHPLFTNIHSTPLNIKIVQANLGSGSELNSSDFGKTCKLSLGSKEENKKTDRNYEEDCFISSTKNRGQKYPVCCQPSQEESRKMFKTKAQVLGKASGRWTKEEHTKFIQGN